MLRLARCSAALVAPPSALAGSPRVRSVERAEARQARSAAAGYAIAAAERIETGDRQPALVCISGPVGSSLPLLLRARDPQTDRLFSGDFARRSRRIHPFMILLSLQNQVAATLSLHFGWTRPCLNSLDEATAFVDLLPNMETLQDQGPVMVIFSSAADRCDDRDWLARRHPGRPVLEGAVALLFDVEGSLGELRSAKSSPEAPDAADLFSERPIAPGLEAGLAVLASLESGSRHDVYALESGGRRRCFEWRAA